MIDIPFSNERVCQAREYYVQVTKEVIYWIVDSFGDCDYNVWPRYHEGEMRFTFRKRNEAMLFKLVWGGNA